MTTSPEAAVKLASMGAPATHVPPALNTPSSLQSDIAYTYVKTAALRVLLAAGFHVLYADVDVLFLRPPFSGLYQDADFEAASGDE